MNQNDVVRMQKLMEECEPDVGIEDLIFKKKKNGTWVMPIFSIEKNAPMATRVDFCPWCGIELTPDHNGHTH